MGGQILRRWRYNTEVPEYYVILEEKNTQKLAETEKTREETAGDVTMQHIFCMQLHWVLIYFDHTMDREPIQYNRILRTRSRAMLPLCPKSLFLTFLLLSNQKLLVTRLDTL